MRHRGAPHCPDLTCTILPYVQVITVEVSSRIMNRLDTCFQCFLSVNPHSTILESVVKYVS
jgi:hypothetical protein